jgi:plastocyanin
MGRIQRILCAAAPVVALAGNAASAAEHRVTMEGMQYQPAAVVAKVGDTIVFVNDDGANHVVFVPTKGHAVNLGAQKPGSTAVLPLRRAGSFEVECVNHAVMLLKVTVQK